MKKLLFPLLPFFAFAIACKKNSRVNTDEVRLQTMKTTDSAGKINALNFQYDQQGRIVLFTSTDNNGNETSLAAVSYSGNEITVTYTPTKTATLYNSTVTWYKLNSNNVPDRRIQTDILNVDEPTAKQRTTQTDTTDYMYDASGLLTTATGSFFDTTWYRDYTGFPQIETQRTKYTRAYTNISNMMTGIVINKVENFKAVRGTIVTGTEYTDEKYTFEYNHKYPNKTDFNNAVVLGEFGVIFNRDYLLNKAYAYIPDKIIYEQSVRYASGTPGPTSFGNTVNLTWKYNIYGFIAEMFNGIKTDFIYNY